mmetsp:Transcript_5757/g.22719  ORF Transcript_5757/g.22719 Transcript_5757/m.22719 type:complete len:297 (-) Transcript_5757:110-1000(-)
MVSCHCSSVSPGKPQMISVAMTMPGTAASNVSHTRLNSSTVYSRFMPSKTALDPLCTGMCIQAYTDGCRIASATASRCAKMYGGFVMPSLSITDPSVGKTAVMARNNAATSVPKSIPYAPVSSEDSHTSETPSAIACSTRLTNAEISYDPRSPRACFVLQYVHAPKQPVLNGSISTNSFRRTFGKSSEGKAFFSSIRTVSPANVRSIASTTRSICVTPNRLTSRNSFAPLSPCGTHPAMTIALFAALPRSMTVFIALWLGFFTVHVFTNHPSAFSGASTSSYPYRRNCPAMNSESE